MRWRVIEMFEVSDIIVDSLIKTCPDIVSLSLKNRENNGSQGKVYIMIVS